MIDRCPEFDVASNLAVLDIMHEPTAAAHLAMIFHRHTEPFTVLQMDDLAAG